MSIVFPNLKLSTRDSFKLGNIMQKRQNSGFCKKKGTIKMSVPTYLPTN